MRKIITVGLIVAAVCIYGWNFILFTRSDDNRQSGGEKRLEASLDKLFATAQPVRFVEKGRNPFSPYPGTQKQVTPVKTTAPAAQSRSALKPPEIKISGIMWNPGAPLAMITLPDGSSTVAKAGESFGDITVKKVEKNRILVSFHKTDFWIDR
jgi:hypothetical protein